MDDWFCTGQEPIAGRRKRERTSMTRAEQTAAATRHLSRGVDVITCPVPLRPEDCCYSRLRPRSKLKMNSPCSALTTVLAGQPDPKIRAKGNCEAARPSKNPAAPIAGAGEPPFPLDRDLSWMTDNAFPTLHVFALGRHRQGESKIGQAIFPRL